MKLKSAAVCGTDTHTQDITRFTVPIVDINVVLNASSENLNSKHVFPTPESPISNNLNNKS